MSLWAFAAGSSAGDLEQADDEDGRSRQSQAPAVELDVEVDINEPLLIVGAFNNWARDVPERELEDYIFTRDEHVSRRGKQESSVRIKLDATKLSFKIISLKKRYHWQLFPSGEGESNKELRIGQRSHAALCIDHSNKAAHGRNFRIWEAPHQSVEVRVVLMPKSVQVWYERLQVTASRPFKDAPHIVKYTDGECTRHTPSSGISALADQFRTESWTHTSSFGVPREVLREVQHEMESLDRLMLPGLTPDDWKRSVEPKPRSRTDRIMWAEDKMLEDLPGIKQLTEMLVKFVFLFTKELGRAGHHLTLAGHHRPMLAVYDEGSFFKPHIDVTTLDDKRVLTAVFYLNPKWDQSLGGALRIKPGSPRYTDIWPEEDSLVLFRADRIQHEVRPSRARRRAITIWFHK